MEADSLRESVILCTEIISPRDPRSENFEEAKVIEPKGLSDKGALKTVLCEEVGERPNVLPTRFVLVTKHRDIGSELLNAWFVLGGHRDREKLFPVHNSTSLCHHSV